MRLYWLEEQVDDLLHTRPVRWLGRALLAVVLLGWAKLLIQWLALGDWR